ncbi:hypothetical protein LWF15_08190 [Kineosporia rhizophila]|uniref:hypothetical protein n=1 Tax=Kineosporia rhizophila TaxID=84633 RepID=UPI000A9C2063|nr:hypothetical protein [Kineosporia rhizophila]MCE0535486.1 hypothetical protein [Kineosporia rhizophila]
MEIRAIDPRDSEWEIADPVFRVHVLSRQQQYAGRGEGAIWSQEWEFTDADVEAVMNWVAENCAANDGYVVYLVVRDSLNRLGQHELTYRAPA